MCDAFGPKMTQKNGLGPIVTKNHQRTDGKAILTKNEGKMDSRPFWPKTTTKSIWNPF